MLNVKMINIICLGHMLLKNYIYTIYLVLYNKINITSSRLIMITFNFYMRLIGGLEIMMRN